MNVQPSPLWHPFTQHGLGVPEIFVESAAGAVLHARGGRKILDAISSWWVNTLGHNHPTIVAAVQKQAAALDQVIFAGFTHGPAETLAKHLVRITDGHFPHVFLSDSGSTAVEVALKMAIGYWHNKGSPRKKVVALEHGYHGDTFGAMAAGARSVFSAGYEPFLFDVLRLPFPVENGANTLATFKQFILENKNDIAAFIIEPLVLGAGGMLMYDKSVFAALAHIAKENKIFLIADEVMTGWGRTGTRFAYQQSGVEPDILCLSKGITGGFLPLGATLATHDIYTAFYGTDRAKMFFHSSSYTGNPLACAAANAAMQVWEDEKLEEQIARISRFHESALHDLNSPHVVNKRQCGTIAAFGVQARDGGYLASIGPHMARFFLDHNVLLRPLGNTLYLLPPYCMTNTQLQTVYSVIHDCLGQDFIRA